MHVRVRAVGKSTDTIIVVESKLSKIDNFRKLVFDKLAVEPKLQRLFYGGKLLENGYTLHDYNIKMNDVIQLMVAVCPKPDDNCDQENKEVKETENKDDLKKKKKKVVYKDALSPLYIVGDLIDMRDKELGAWLEGKIIRIVLNPVLQICDINIPDNKLTLNNSTVNGDQEGRNENDKLLYQIQLDDDDGDEESNYFCDESDIRPRARNEILIEDLKVGQTVMLNHNTEEPLEKGHWYDFKVNEIIKLKKNYKLQGTLYIGAGALLQIDKDKIIDHIFAIEEVVPVEKRSEDYQKLMTTQPNKRASPLNCLTCRDNEDTPCKDCGCYICSSKENPEKIILCDECDTGYHMACVSPPLMKLPEDDWYCPTCKRDTNEVIAPGASKQTKKASTMKINRDWGRGMACVGKTKACSMPLNHFGPIPGIEVGMCWRFRIQLSESGVHRPPVSGIHGRDVEGAYSIVLSGGYEDDVDNGNEFTYTGSGGRDLSGNKRTAEQSCDQELTRQNKALARNCAVKKICEDGADAGDDWRNGKPVRVVRSYKMLKHFPKYAPQEGIRYDGIYKVVKYYPEKGLSGFRVWKYLLRRDDPSPAPWEENAKQYPVIYPEGYLEAEEEKQKTSEKPRKRTRVSDNESPRKKKRLDDTIEKIDASPKNKQKNTLRKMFKYEMTSDDYRVLSTKEMDAIKTDSQNSKLWDECLDIFKSKGKKEFVERVNEIFRCIICQDVACNPVNMPCKHIFCIKCIKMAFKVSKACPSCRNSLTDYDPELNAELTTALRAIMPGYDVGRI